MKLMAIDYGDVRTGIAVSDPNGILAYPFTVIREADTSRLADKIIRIAEEENPQKIIVGNPRNMDGSYGFRSEKCRAFADLLQSRLNAEIIMEDERLTTVMAHEVLTANDVRGKRRKNMVDSVSAVMILQSYIEKQK